MAPDFVLSDGWKSLDKVWRHFIKGEEGMKTIRLLALAILTFLCADAFSQDSTVHKTPQHLKYGYFSYKQALEAMPGYDIAKKRLAEIKAKHEAELKRAEEEFNAKYEEFLDEQRDFAPAILRKRQAEIKDLIDKNLAFKDETKKLLKDAETELFGQLKTQLANAILKVGKEKGYAFILNTDSNSVPFINPAFGEDALQAIKDETRK